MYVAQCILSQPEFPSWVCDTRESLLLWLTQEQGSGFHGIRMKFDIPYSWWFCDFFLITLVFHQFQSFSNLQDPIKSVAILV